MARVLVLVNQNPFQHYLWVTASNSHFFHVRQSWQWAKRDISGIHLIGDAKEKGGTFLFFILPLTSRTYTTNLMYCKRADSCARLYIYHLLFFFFFKPFPPTSRALLHPFFTRFGEKTRNFAQASGLKDPGRNRPSSCIWVKARHWLG